MPYRHTARSRNAELTPGPQTNSLKAPLARKPNPKSPHGSHPAIPDDPAALTAPLPKPEMDRTLHRPMNRGPQGHTPKRERDRTGVVNQGGLAHAQPTAPEITGGPHESELNQPMASVHCPKGNLCGPTCQAPHGGSGGTKGLSVRRRARPCHLILLVSHIPSSPGDRALGTGETL
jgi:hypothetical protein